MSDALGRLAAEVRAMGGLLGATVVDAGGEARHGEAAAGGSRASGREAEYALLVEAIREGYELHYGRPRVVGTADADLALLAGDRLYALGLARLTDLGDLEAVAELADVISLGAQANAEGRPAMAEAAWEAGARAVGAGSTPGHQADKAAWRDGAQRAD